MLVRRPSPHVRRQVLTGLLITAAYVLAAKLGFRVAFVAEQVTTVWPPTGLAEASLILWGRSLWPAIWLGAFIANVNASVPIWVAAAVATGNTLESFAVASLLSRIRGFDPALRRVRDALAFAVAGGILATAISATIGVAALCVAGVQPWSRFTALWSDWWLGDAVGALVVAPALLTTFRISTTSSWRIRVETGALVIGCMLVTELVFGHLVDRAAGHHPLEYVIFPFVVAAAVRIGQPATALVILGASVVTIANTIRGTGPFAGADVHQGLILLQVFTGVLAGTGLLLAAAMVEQKTGERRRAAGHGVGEVLAEAPSLADAAPAILRSICTELDRGFGALWLIDRGAQRLRCLAVWRDPRVPMAFETVTRETRFSTGVGLPGRVWASGKPLWVENIVEDSHFPRQDVAVDAGIRGAFAFPICLGSTVLGVVECFNRGVMAADADLLRTMSAVGDQIGQFMERKRIEDAVALAELEREKLLQSESNARREAEAASRAKDEFLATLSHELRTPLNAIVGWARMLLDGTLDDGKKRRALEVIDRNAALQVRLVDDILDVSRIVAGRLTLEVQTVDVGSVVAAAVDAIRPSAKGREIEIHLDVSTSACDVEGDPQRLQQIVRNVLANAVKFTDSGGRIDVELGDGGSDRVRIVVRDNGIGIDPSFLTHAFERFRQADGTVSREHGGLGLGLAIVRHLVELHGGTVRVESAGVGHGSTFTIDLPRRTPIQSPNEPRRTSQNPVEPRRTS
jgi:signal transduction histidine kinase/integral membrane sensor domain MASE1